MRRGLAFGAVAAAPLLAALAVTGGRFWPDLGFALAMAGLAAAAFAAAVRLGARRRR